MSVAAVLDLRDYGGRQGGMLQSLVAAHKPVTRAAPSSSTTLQGRVDQHWGGLWELRNVTGGAPLLKPALDKANSDYIQFFAGLRDEMAKYFETGRLPIDGSTYRERTFRMWNVAIRPARRRVRRLRACHRQCHRLRAPEPDPLVVGLVRGCLLPLPCSWWCSAGPFVRCSR